MNRVIGVLLTAALPGAVAVAAEEHAAHAAPSIGTLALPIVNFVIFVGVFWHFAWPLIAGALTERRKLAEKEIAEADETRRAAEAMMADIEARRAGLRETGERLVRELRTDAEHERQRLLEAARQSADRIRKDAQLLGGQESEQAAHRIREEVAAQVVSLVVAKLREQLTPGDEERFVREFVGAVESGATR
jgi:F0F1-type ATP synthase membrane subunit b/b'